MPILEAGASAPAVTASHQAFRDKYALNFPPLSDPDHKVAAQWPIDGAEREGQHPSRAAKTVIKARPLWQ